MNADPEFFFACGQLVIEKNGVEAILAKHGSPAGFLDELIRCAPQTDRASAMKQWLIDNRAEAEQRLGCMLGMV